LLVVKDRNIDPETVKIVTKHRLVTGLLI